MQKALSTSSEAFALSPQQSSGNCQDHQGRLFCGVLLDGSRPIQFAVPPRNLSRGSVAFGRRFGELRRERGLSQELVSERSRISYKYVQRIERGEINVTLKTIRAIARALRARPAELLEPPRHTAARPAGRPRGESYSPPSKYRKSRRFVGVFSRHGAWYSQFRSGGERFTFGPFKLERAAAEARDARIRSTPGCRAPLNFPDAD